MDKKEISQKEAEKVFFITTAIHYVSDIPHIGHAYEMIAADILARYWRRKGRETFYLAGTDEHGQKIFQAAQKRGSDPQTFVNEVSLHYKAAWASLEIRYDNFIRTTDPRHEKYVQEFVQKLYDLGEIYQGRYEGLYCVGCEEYKTQNELQPGDICPIHKKKCEAVFEDIYFFKLSKFQPQILEAIEKNKIEIAPVARRNEILSFLKKEPLKDLAMTRSKVRWGIPVPWDKNQTIYVWVDALLNYLSGSRGHWPPSLQLIGKDIFRFHSIIWPGMLLAAGLELPQKIFIHGFLTVGGEKISKTRGNIIDPLQVARIYGVDALRYFLFREVPFGQDGDFTIDRFERRYQADLANDLGNLVQRVITLAAANKIQWTYRTITKSFYEIDRKIENLEFNLALDLIWDMIIEANKKIEVEKPWQLTKKPHQLQRVISELLDGISHIAYLIEPFLPETTWLIVDQLKSLKPEPLFPRHNK